MATCAKEGPWDLTFLAMAEIAMARSKDPRSQVGAILASPDCRRIAMGYNGPPPGFNDDVWGMMDRDTKNRYALHAEDNAIANAATDVRGWTLYVTKAPCLDCALAIRRAGITRLVTPPIDPNSLWADNQMEAEGYLAQAGVMQERVA